MSPTLNIAFIMDPLATVKAEKDTTYFLMLAAKKRGHRVFSIHQDNLYLDHDQLFSKVMEVDVFDDIEKPFEEIDTQVMNLSEMQVIWLRPDPPFDRRYFYSTLFLDFLPDSVKVVNHPQAVRDWNEKLGALFYSQWTPKTLMTSDIELAKNFLEKEKKAVLKPIDGFGGRGISLLDISQRDAVEKIKKLIGDDKKKIIMQEMVEEAHLGDKRILLVDGEPIGAILRVSGTEGGLNNLDQGGHAVACDLTENDLKVCADLKQRLKSEGLFFVGIDMLGDKLTEVNVTSPTGLQELVRFSQTPHHMNIIEKLEGLR